MLTVLSGVACLGVSAFLMAVVKKTPTTKTEAE